MLYPFHSSRSVNVTDKIDFVPSTNLGTFLYPTLLFSGHLLYCPPDVPMMVEFHQHFPSISYFQLFIFTQYDRFHLHNLTANIW